MTATREWWNDLLPREKPYSVVRFDESVPPTDTSFATKQSEVDHPSDAPDKCPEATAEIVVYDRIGRMVKRTDGSVAPSVLF
ncbi:hypothetical protein C454_11413 [Haloferax gibbonsii ATCC 33959]|uniref:Uncharacterized protein n=1 Tax=Haloferax gibbonsii (strain ATCC 33959 / DSM 4427 / JCM 8863 / NBRC 102184 / NCIMB 2188 / Ma 2.38) TaxID=1227459 RepID=M0H7K8_HALGM|nr:hypothetical protein [Haloferax gibbonsii]ELZ79808.1 hypothetical protein C454_11413 [Haloferax gibbonsii ATCC 33959]